MTEQPYDLRKVIEELKTLPGQYHETDLEIYLVYIAILVLAVRSNVPHKKVLQRPSTTSKAFLENE